MSTYQTPLAPKPGVRASRVTPSPEPKRQPVTNREWQAQRRRARHQSIWANTFEGLFDKLLRRAGR